MKRKDNWPELLATFFKDREHVPFSWQEPGQDCARFACDAVLAMTDVDLAEEFRGGYKTALQAIRLIKRLSGGGLEEVSEQAAARHGIVEIEVLCAGRGDVVLLTAPRLNDQQPIFPLALGVVDMHGTSVVTAGAQGTESVPLTSPQCLRAWRIP